MKRWATFGAIVCCLVMGCSTILGVEGTIEFFDDAGPDGTVGHEASHCDGTVGSCCDNGLFPCWLCADGGHGAPEFLCMVLPDSGPPNCVDAGPGYDRCSCNNSRDASDCPGPYQVCRSFDPLNTMGECRTCGELSSSNEDATLHLACKDQSACNPIHEGNTWLNSVCK
jgi:hypothetical protein